MTFARQLRKQQTDAETKLWFLLRDRRFLGLKFRRQVPMQAYILDFYCHELWLAVELDGGQHNVREHEERDKTRTEALATHGVAVASFLNDASSGYRGGA
ncbi:MAG: endonuclease domain-containing protein [Lysobacterales bacterium]